MTLEHLEGNVGTHSFHSGLFFPTLPTTPSDVFPRDGIKRNLSYFDRLRTVWLAFVFEIHSLTNDEKIFFFFSMQLEEVKLHHPIRQSTALLIVELETSHIQTGSSR